MGFISVVVPAYNAEHFLADCLDSLIAQTLTDWRAVVIDDGSTDGTFALAQRYAAQDSRIQAHTFPNGKLPVARNRGLALMPEAEYILMVDSDDYLTPDAMETLVRHLESEPKAVAAYGLPRFVDTEGQPLTHDLDQAYGAERKDVACGRLASVPANAPTTFAGLVIWPCIATLGQVLIRVSAQKKAGEYDPGVVFSEDWDMWLRLSTQGDFVLVRQFLLNKRSHNDNMSSKGKAMAVAEPILRRKLANPALYTEEQRRLAWAGHRASCVIKLDWAREALREGKVLRALKTVYHAARSYVRFQRTWSGRVPTKVRVPDASKVTLRA